MLAVLLLLALAACPAALRAESPSSAPPQDEILEATVGHVVEERESDVSGQRQLYQKLELIISSGPKRGEVIVVEQGTYPQVNLNRYRVGDRVFVRSSAGVGATPSYYLEGPSRWMALAGVSALFAVIVMVLSRWRGLASLSGLVISFAVLFVYILPRLGAGQEPLRVILIGGALIVPPSFYLAHGFSLKTTIAVVGTALSLVLTVFLALFVIRWIGLTGYASEEAAFLQVLSPGVFDIRDLLLAGIVVGALGILDDVTVSQAAIVQQLREANPQLGFRELYRRAMRVGQDHIASVVNTLALVYAGAALPLLLLLRTSPLPLTYLLSQEIIAEEIARMMVASIGLMAAVPLTTLLAAATISFARKTVVSAE
jgi:uncharacterized membrane protein